MVTHGKGICNRIYEDFMENHGLLDHVLKSLRTFFGSLNCPNFSKVQEYYERNPHRMVITQLMHHFVVEDATDLNTDIAVVLSLVPFKNKDEKFRIELSLVDKFVALFVVENESSIVVTDRNRNNSECVTILKLLEKENYILIPKEILTSQIPFNRPNSNGNSTVYNALFSDVELD